MLCFFHILHYFSAAAHIPLNIYLSASSFLIPGHWYNCPFPVQFPDNPEDFFSVLQYNCLYLLCFSDTFQLYCRVPLYTLFFHYLYLYISLLFQEVLLCRPLFHLRPSDILWDSLHTDCCSFSFLRKDFYRFLSVLYFFPEVPEYTDPSVLYSSHICADAADWFLPVPLMTQYISSGLSV